MLPHWFKRLQQDELLVLIQPQRLSLLRIRRSARHYFKPRVIAHSVIDINAEMLNTSQPESKVERWANVTAALNEALNQQKWQDTIANVMLSNHFVRYTTIPWNEHVSKPAEHQAYVSHCFNLVFGEQIKSWHLQAAPVTYGKSSMASAVPQALLTTLHATLQSANIILNAVTPQLIPAISQCLAQLNKPLAKTPRFLPRNNTHSPSCLVIIQQDRVCMAFIVDGNWICIQNVMIETDVSAQVLAFIQRATINHHVLTPPTVFLYWHEHPTQSLNLQEHLVIKVPTLQDNTLEAVQLTQTNWELA